MKEQVTRVCGHVEEVNICGDREAELAWEQRKYCRKCWRKIYKDALQARTQMANEMINKLGLPQLEGSKKQIQWAEELRILRVCEIINYIGTYYVDAFVEKLVAAPEKHQFGRALYCKSAADWIKTRELSLDKWSAALGGEAN